MSIIEGRDRLKRFQNLTSKRSSSSISSDVHKKETKNEKLDINDFDELSQLQHQLNVDNESSMGHGRTVQSDYFSNLQSVEPIERAFSIPKMMLDDCSFEHNTHSSDQSVDQLIDNKTVNSTNDPKSRIQNVKQWALKPNETIFQQHSVNFNDEAGIGSIKKDGDDSKYSAEHFTTVSSIRSSYQRRKRQEEFKNASSRLLSNNQNIHNYPSSSHDSNSVDGGVVSYQHASESITSTPAMAAAAQGSSQSRLLTVFPNAIIFPDLSYQAWCNDLTYRLTITSKVRDKLKAGNRCLLQAPVGIRNSLISTTAHRHTSISIDGGMNGGREDDRMETIRQSKLVLQSLFNDVLLNSGCISMPTIEFWGPTPDTRIAEVLVEPHRKYLQ